MSTILVLGGSGLVGARILALALADPAIARVVAPTRRALAAHPKLLNPLVDFDALPPTAAWWGADAALCALGSTRRSAGSDAAFRRIDHDYVLAAAALAHSAGTPVFVYVSSLGANAGASALYTRVKGETERDLAGLGFASLCHVRPALLDGGPRPETRPAESVGLWFARLLAPVLPLRYHAVSTRAVASTMLAAALQARPGLRIIESEQIAH